MRTTTLVFAPPPLREMADARSASPSSRLLELEADADEALPEYFTRPDSSEIHHMQPRVTQRKDAHQEDLAATAAATSSAATSSAAAEIMDAVPSDDAAVQPMPQLPRRRRVVGRTKPRAPSKTAKVLAEEAAAGVREMSEAISEDAAARARAIRGAISSAKESKLASEAAKWQASHQSFIPNRRRKVDLEYQKALKRKAADVPKGARVGASVGRTIIRRHQREVHQPYATPVPADAASAIEGLIPEVRRLDASHDRQVSFSDFLVAVASPPGVALPPRVALPPVINVTATTLATIGNLSAGPAPAVQRGRRCSGSQDDFGVCFIDTFAAIGSAAEPAVARVQQLPPHLRVTLRLLTPAAPVAPSCAGATLSARGDPTSWHRRAAYAGGAGVPAACAGGAGGAAPAPGCSYGSNVDSRSARCVAPRDGGEGSGAPGLRALGAMRFEGVASRVRVASLDHFYPSGSVELAEQDFKHQEARWWQAQVCRRMLSSGFEFSFSAV
jgi:hypothetical protein